MNEWIPITERMPEPDTDEVFLVTHVNVGNPSTKWVAQMHFDGEWEFVVIGEGLARYRANGTRVIAWMPQPEPWQGEAIMQ